MMGGDYFFKNASITMMTVKLRMVIGLSGAGRMVIYRQLEDRLGFQTKM